MSFLEDHEEDLMLSMYEWKNAVERITNETDDKIVLRDALDMIHNHDLDYDNIDKIKGILKNVQKFGGRMTFKQKWCLCDFLLSEHKDYTAEDEDHPFYSLK